MAPESNPGSNFAEYDYSNFYYGAGDDPMNLLGPFSEWYREALPNGYYLYSEPLQGAPETRVHVRNRKTGRIHDLINMASYNYLGISYRPEVKEAAIKAVEKSTKELRCDFDDPLWLYLMLAERSSADE